MRPPSPAPIEALRTPNRICRQLLTSHRPFEYLYNAINSRFREEARVVDHRRLRDVRTTPTPLVPLLADKNPEEEWLKRLVEDRD